VVLVKNQMTKGFSMITRRPHRRYLGAARYLTVVALGVMLAFVVGHHAEAQSVSAANHCTHYTPPYSIDNQYGCADLHAVSGGQNYQTNNTALRDDNTAAASPNQNMCVWYYYGGIHNWTCATGPSVHIGQGSGSNYAYSFCDFTNSSNSGLCETTWHD
jgi:hypothetical protein